MKRSLRSRGHVVKIESSDSDCSIQEISSDEENVATKEGINTVQLKSKYVKTGVDLTISNITTANRRNTTKKQISKDATFVDNINVKNKKPESMKRKSKDGEERQTPEKRQRKLGTARGETSDLKSLNSQVLNVEQVSNATKKISKNNANAVECIEWTNAEYTSEVNNVSKHIAENVIRLFDEDNTIPFIARYRKNITGGMEPDQLRAFKESYDQAKVVKQRATLIIKSIDKLGKWTPELHSAIKSTKSLTDLEHIYSLFKPTSKKSLAERARQLGLEPISASVLEGNQIPLLYTLVDKEKQGLDSEERVREGIIHIIADRISKDRTIFDKLKIIQKATVIEIHTQEKKTEVAKNKQHTVDEKKYETYFNWKTTDRFIKPHQILAINRGEAQKMLTVKVVIPDAFEAVFKTYCLQYYRPAVSTSNFHSALINESIDYAYKKLIKPLIIRRLRNDLKDKAETASIEVFVSNVKQLLLTPPVRGKVILGIDPGYYHGCKLAVVSEQGNVLDSAVIYPHNKGDIASRASAKTLVDLVKKHKASIIALGNATACRETETFLTNIIQQKGFGSINVSYAIVDEAGASIYSCGSEAKSEFPNTDPNIISAISIARRLQDPLAELVKVEPKHLGVGMYQHDLPEKQLLLSLNEVVSEAVSFVGVDINTASHCLLKRVAGLNVSRAANIIEWRNMHGSFINRDQLLKVKGIGNKTFEQCAGFIRILPETALLPEHVASNKSSVKCNMVLNLLDQTWIHPESYNVAKKFLNYCKSNLDDLGSLPFIEGIKSHAKVGASALARQFDTDETTMEIIIKGLTMQKNEDIRLKENAPLFRNSLLSIKDLDVDTVLSGAVRNITHFGAFVDVGVGREGLLHIKWLKNQILSIGQRVEVKVLFIDRDRNRINLGLVRTL